jgi:TatD DNase family protein
MLIDTHCHLDFPDFDAERDLLVARAADAGVRQIITISTLVHRFDRIKAITEAYPNVYCSVGTHPNHAHEEPDIETAELVALAEYKKCVAIGEAGLDYFYDYATPEQQARGLRRHIAAARITGLPLVIHARAADDDMAAILIDEHEQGAFPFLLHCFSSGPALAATGVRLGGYVSFSGILTFPKSADIRDIARSVPRDRLLVETDAPYLAPKTWRGKRNEPSYVTNTADVLAETIGVSSAEIAEITTANAYRCFSRMPELATG